MDILNVVKLVDEWDILYDGVPAHIAFEPLMLSIVAALSLLLKAQVMLECHIIHGDLSPNNFIIHDGQGYFTDFDNARITHDASSNIKLQGTGTGSYMLIHLLQESVENNGKEVMVIPTAGDDLESLFYIFIKFATIFDGPCAKKRDKTEKPIWDGLFSLFGQNSWTSKMGLVLSHHSNMSLMSLTTPFFAPFQPIIQEWRHLILAADAASESSSINGSLSFPLRCLKTFCLLQHYPSL
ncbi:hypothetical protein DFH29DRAFT_1007702 [Suillus ampliporus]|nr:hypothetical protein DFH29DRAFT_1007702 [Suillus ampliporus]